MRKSIFLLLLIAIGLGSCEDSVFNTMDKLTDGVWVLEGSERETLDFRKGGTYISETFSYYPMYESLAFPNVVEGKWGFGGNTVTFLEITDIYHNAPGFGDNFVPGQEYDLLEGSVDARDDDGNLLIDPSTGEILVDFDFPGLVDSNVWKIEVLTKQHLVLSNPYWTNRYRKK